jgi:hypothetical protein
MCAELKRLIGLNENFHQADEGQQRQKQDSASETHDELERRFH